MEANEFFHLLKNKQQTIISLTVLFVLLGLALTAAQPFRYGSKLRLLVFQNGSETGTDPYAMTRANEYLSNEALLDEKSPMSLSAIGVALLPNFATSLDLLNILYLPFFIKPR